MRRDRSGITSCIVYIEFSLSLYIYACATRSGSSAHRLRLFFLAVSDTALPDRLHLLQSMTSIVAHSTVQNSGSMLSLNATI